MAGIPLPPHLSKNYRDLLSEKSDDNAKPAPLQQPYTAKYHANRQPNFSHGRSSDRYNKPQVEHNLLRRPIHVDEDRYNKPQFEHNLLKRPIHVDEEGGPDDVHSGGTDYYKRPHMDQRRPINVDEEGGPDVHSGGIDYYKRPHLEHNRPIYVDEEGGPDVHSGGIDYDKRPHLEHNRPIHVDEEGGPDDVHFVMDEGPNPLMEGIHVPRQPRPLSDLAIQAKQEEILKLLRKFPRPVSTKEIIQNCGHHFRYPLNPLIFDLSDRGVILKAGGRLQAWRINNNPPDRFFPISQEENPNPFHGLSREIHGPLPSFDDLTSKRNVNENSIDLSSQTSKGPPLPPHMLTTNKDGKMKTPVMNEWRKTQQYQDDSTQLSRSAPLLPHIKPRGYDHIDIEYEHRDRLDTNKINYQDKFNDNRCMLTGGPSLPPGDPPLPPNRLRDYNHSYRGTSDLEESYSMRESDECSLRNPERSRLLPHRRDFPLLDEGKPQGQSNVPPLSRAPPLSRVSPLSRTPLLPTHAFNTSRGNNVDNQGTNNRAYSANRHLSNTGPPAPPHLLNTGPPAPPHLLNTKAVEQNSSLKTDVVTRRDTTSDDVYSSLESNENLSKLSKGPPAPPHLLNTGPPAPPHLLNAKAVEQKSPPKTEVVTPGDASSVDVYSSLESDEKLSKLSKGPPTSPHLLNTTTVEKHSPSKTEVITPKDEPSDDVYSSLESDEKLLKPLKDPPAPQHLLNTTAVEQNSPSKTEAVTPRDAPTDYVSSQEPGEKLSKPSKGPPVPPHLLSTAEKSSPKSHEYISQPSKGPPQPPHMMNPKESEQMDTSDVISPRESHERYTKASKGPPPPPHMLNVKNERNVPDVDENSHSSKGPLLTPDAVSGATSHVQTIADKSNSRPLPPRMLMGGSGQKNGDHLNNQNYNTRPPIQKSSGPPLPPHLLGGGGQNRGTPPSSQCVVPSKNIPQQSSVLMRQNNPPICRPNPPLQKPSQQPPAMLSSEIFNSFNKNPVSALNEMAQKQGKEVIFELLNEARGGKNKFTVAVKIGDRIYDAVSASNMKEAKRDAADAALRAILGQNAFNIKSRGSDDIITNIRNPPSTGLPHFDNIASLSNHAFLQLSSMIQVKFAGRKVIACMVMQDGYGDGGRVVSLGSGNRCITGERLNLEGKTVNDSHAEIICRRGFIRFLYSELEKFYDNNDSIFEGGGMNGKAKVKDGVLFHLYISTAPCGDGALFSPRENNVASALPREHTPEFSSKPQGILRTKIEDGEGTIPIPPDEREQTIDGILRGQRLRTMSCSDKVCRWNVLGLQGALLSNIIEPIYLESLTLGYLFDHAHLSRAVCCRLDKDSKLDDDLPMPFYVNHPWIGRVTRYDVSRETEKTNNISVNWCACDTSPEVTDGRLGACLTRTDNAPTPSRLCKLEMFRRFRQIIGKSDALKELLSIDSYREVKEKAVDFQAAKKCMLRKFMKAKFGNWLCKPTEQDSFVCT